MGRLAYLILGVLALGTAGIADYRGWTLTRPTELHNVPKSIRDNPGSYRSIYSGSPRYFGGK
jgi:hypothetical protein